MVTDNAALVNTDDADLVQEWMNGNMSAFEELHRRYDQRVFVAICHELRRHSRAPHHIAEELCQETWIKARDKLAAGSPDPDEFQNRPFYPWLHTIALNLTRNWLRTRGNQEEPTSPDEIEDSTPPVTTGEPAILDNLIKEERIQIVRETIEEVQEPYRSVLRLSSEGYTDGEIALELDRKPNTVRTQFRRGVQKFKQILLRQHPDLFDE
jgi:RNA polymerase sigma-70 factor, ECF subfamily